MLIELKTTYCVHRVGDPEAYINPVELTLIESDEGNSFAVGKILADRILTGAAGTDGMPLVDVFDADEWIGMYETLYRKGELRKELRIEDFIDSILIIYRIFLAPCLTGHHAAILDAVMDCFPMDMLIVLNSLSAISTSDLAVCGFARIAGRDIGLRHNACRTPISSENPELLDFLCEPTQEDEDWVLEKIEKFRKHEC